MSASCVARTNTTELTSDKPVDNRARLSTSETALGDGGVSSFYRISVESTPNRPGVLLRDEPLEPHQSVPGAAKNLRVLYTSSNGLKRGEVVTVSGSIFLPQGEAPKGGWPLIVWSHGTVGIADVCAPTWTGYVPFHEEYLKQWLDQGYAIIASDYQGLGTLGTHPYLATKPAAFNNLDFIRATKGEKYNFSDKVVVIGQSQGAGAAIATAAYAPEYAPEVDLLGVVATGVPYFSPETLIAIQKTRPRDKVDPMLGYNFLALTLVEQLLPEFDLEDYVFDEILPTAKAVSNVCNRDMRQRITQEGLSYDNTFKKSPAEPLKVAFAQMGYPTLKIETPIYLGVGSVDRDTPPRMQALFAKKACAAGSRMKVHLYNGFDHLKVLNHSTVDSIPFVKHLMSGGDVTSNCDSLPF
jgi:pimeloyl-ACP methyl ester carboxylesterase